MEYEHRLFFAISLAIGLEAIKTWREHPEHKEVQRLGRELFYSWYEIKVVKVERGYEWSLKKSIFTI